MGLTVSFQFILAPIGGNAKLTIFLESSLESTQIFVVYLAIMVLKGTRYEKIFRVVVILTYVTMIF
eukprot:7723-Heterococcus_DN1.PRE.1